VGCFGLLVFFLSIYECKYEKRESLEIFKNLFNNQLEGNFHFHSFHAGTHSIWVNGMNGENETMEKKLAIV